jgi:hypothetical protein
LITAMGAACAGPAALASRPPLDPISARYRDQLDRARAGGGAPGAGGPLAATWSYRRLVAPALGSRCQMLPSDSESFDRRARRCGIVGSVVGGVARVLLEASATPSLLDTTVSEGQLRFVDLPAAADPCGR